MNNEELSEILFSGDTFESIKFHFGTGGIDDLFDEDIQWLIDEIGLLRQKIKELQG